MVLLVSVCKMYTTHDWCGVGEGGNDSERLLFSSCSLCQFSERSRDVVIFLLFAAEHRLRFWHSFIPVSIGPKMLVDGERMSLGCSNRWTSSDASWAMSQRQPLRFRHAGAGLAWSSTRLQSGHKVHCQPGSSPASIHSYYNSLRVFPVLSMAYHAPVAYSICRLYIFILSSHML